jgi:phage antirepressor YoqD-like protein
MTPIEEIFKALETLNQNDFIDWLLANKQTLIENGKMYLHQRQESSEQSATNEMGDQGSGVHSDIHIGGSPTENFSSAT